MIASRLSVMLVPLLVGVLTSQEVPYRAEELKGTVTVRVPLGQRWDLLSIEADVEANGELHVELQGKKLGDLGEFRLGRKACRLDVGLDESWTTLATDGFLSLVLSQKGEGAVTRVRARQIPGALVRITLWDPEAKGKVPGLVELTSMGGLDLPWFGRLSEGGPAGRTWLIPDGVRSVILPAEVSMTLTAYRHPFATFQRRTLTAEATKTIPLRLEIGEGQRPEGSELVDSIQALDAVSARYRKEYLRAFGSERMLLTRSPYPASEAERDPYAFTAHLLDPFSLPPVLSTVRGADGLLPGPFAPRTLELRTGQVLHSDGPILEIDPLVRVQGSASISVRLRVVPVDADGVLEVMTQDRTLHSEPVKEARRLTLRLEVSPGERLLFRFQSPPRLGSERGFKGSHAWTLRSAP